MSKNTAQKITIDNVEYKLEDLSEEVKNNLGMLKALEQEVQHLNIQLAIAKTAQLTYAKVVKANLPNK